MTGRAAMTYLFSNEGLAALDAFADAETLFAFDLDGTLAPSSQIRTVSVCRRRPGALLEMTSRAVVAIITGRPEGMPNTTWVSCPSI
jgi:trehalose 6-phosphate phosphatase